MEASSLPLIKMQDTLSPEEQKNDSCSLKVAGIALALIIGLGTLAIGGAGLSNLGTYQGWWHTAVLLDMNQMDSINYLVAGVSGAVLFLGLGVAKSVQFSEAEKKRKIKVPTIYDEKVWEKLGYTVVGDIPKQPDIDWTQPCPFTKPYPKPTKLLQNLSKLKGEQTVGVEDFSRLSARTKKNIKEPDYVPPLGYKKVIPTLRDTHFLLFVPAKVKDKDGKEHPITLDFLKKVGCDDNSSESNFNYYDRKVQEVYGNKEVKNGYWVLMTNSRIAKKKPSLVQQEKKMRAKDLTYEISNIIETVLGSFFELSVRNNLLAHPDATTKSSGAYIFCAEPYGDKGQVVSISGFSPKKPGLRVDKSYDNDGTAGIIGVKRYAAETSTE